MKIPKMKLISEVRFSGAERDELTALRDLMEGAIRAHEEATQQALQLRDARTAMEEENRRIVAGDIDAETTHEELVQRITDLQARLSLNAAAIARKEAGANAASAEAANACERAATVLRKSASVIYDAAEARFDEVCGELFTAEFIARDHPFKSLRRHMLMHTNSMVEGSRRNERASSMVDAVSLRAPIARRIELAVAAINAELDQDAALKADDANTPASGDLVTAAAVLDEEVVFAPDEIGAEMVGPALPESLMWMPPGIHTINARRGGQPWSGIVIVDAAAAARVQASFAQMRAEAEAGTGDLPFFDANHADEEATAHPTEFYWAGSDPRTGGIRAKVQWTAKGREYVLGKSYRRFSPTFRPNDDGTFDVIGANLGGLVNRAAFRTIAPVLGKDAAEGGDVQAKACVAGFMARAEQISAARGIDLDSAMAALASEDHAAYVEFIEAYNYSPPVCASAVAIDGQISPEERKAVEAEIDRNIQLYDAFMARVREVQDLYGCSTVAAINKVAAEFPDLHRGYVFAITEGGGAMEARH